MLVFRFDMQGEVVIEHTKREVSCVYIFGMQEAILLEHTNTKWHSCTRLVNLKAIVQLIAHPHSLVWFTSEQ
jgi:hypothetical protein